MKFKYSKFKKRLSLVLSLGILMSSFPYSNLYAQESIKKYETVYVNLHSDGSKRETIVSNWLKDSQLESEILDKTDIKDIKNVSSDKKPVFKNNGDILWNTNHSDVFYQGTTDKEIPVEVKVKYYLDGKEIKPQDLAGKSGKVKIAVDFINKTKEKVLVNGRYKEVSTPFTVVSVLGLDNEKFTDVVSDNGKLYSDGNNQMVMFIGFPGLNQSLNIDNTTIDAIKDVEIPHGYTVEAYVKDFELSSIAVAVTPELPDMVKDIDNNTKDLEEDKNDIDIALNMRDTLDKVDPEDTIKDLIRNKEKTEDAKILVDDIFKYYDLDTEIMEILPKYVTKENVDLIYKTRADLRDVQIRKILDNQVLRYIPDRFNDKQIDKSRLLLDDYDELKDFDMDIFDKALDVINDYDNLQEMLDISKNLYEKIKQNDKKLDDLEKFQEYSIRTLDLFDRISPYENLNTSSVKDDLMRVLKEAHIPENQIQKVANGLQSVLYNQIRDLREIRSDIDQLKTDIQVDIGYDYRVRLRDSMEFVDEIMPEIRTLRDREKKNRETLTKAIDLGANHDDMEYLKYWANRAKEMKDDMDYNDENIEIMRDVLNEYDKPYVKHFYESIPKLRDDMDKLRPIGEGFSDELDIEKYDKSFKESYKTIETVLDIKHDLDSKKYVSDALKLSLSDEVVDAARKLIEVIDRRDEKGDLDKAKDNIDDLLDMSDRKDAIVKLSDDYTSFTGKNPTMKSKVSFVMKTDEIEKDDDNKYVKVEEPRKGFIQWLKGLFTKK